LLDIDLSNLWFFPYVNFAFDNKIIKGYSDYTFRPYQYISLPEALKIIFKTQNINTKHLYKNYWYDEYITQAKKLEFLEPNGPIKNDINHYITRGEMVWMIYKLSKINASNVWYKPKPLTSWQWQLSGDIDTSYNVEMYDIDLEETSQEKIDELHEQGKKVICYFNSGSYEPYRSDSKDFPLTVLGGTMQGWEDEKWLDISKYEKFADIMKNRLDLAVEKKCDGVEPDNMDGFQNETGFQLTYEDQLKYNKWLATEAHKRKLSIGLKNDLDQIKDLVDYFDFAVNEQCYKYNECDLLKPFINQKKAVFHVEYELELKNFCKKANEIKFSSLKMKYDLSGARIGCQNK